MNQYDARQQFIEGLDRYVSGIESDQGLERLAKNVRAYHDRMPSDACDMVSAIVWPIRRFTASYAGASEVLLQRLRASERRSSTSAKKWFDHLIFGNAKVTYNA
jgi:hypothetical protein